MRKNHFLTESKIKNIKMIFFDIIFESSVIFRYNRINIFDHLDIYMRVYEDHEIEDFSSCIRTSF